MSDRRQTRPVMNGALVALVGVSSAFNAFGLVLLLAPIPGATALQGAAKAFAMVLALGLLAICEVIGFLGLEGARSSWRARARLTAGAALVFVLASVALNAAAGHNAVQRIEALVSAPAVQLEEQALIAERRAAQLEAEQAVLKARIQRLSDARAAEQAALLERLRATPETHSSNAVQQANLLIASREASQGQLAELEGQLLALARELDAARLAAEQAHGAARQASLHAPELAVWLAVAFIEALKAFGRSVLAFRAPEPPAASASKLDGSPLLANAAEPADLAKPQSASLASSPLLANASAPADLAEPARAGKPAGQDATVLRFTPKAAQHGAPMSRAEAGRLGGLIKAHGTERGRALFESQQRAAGQA